MKIPMSLNYCAIRTALSALLLHFISAKNVTSTTSPDQSSTWTTTITDWTTTIAPQMTTATAAAHKNMPPVVFVIIGVVVTLIVIVVVIAVILILRRPKQFTGLDNLLVGNDGISSLNGGAGTQVPLMDSSYETGGAEITQDTGNSEYLSRAVVKYRFEANEDYKDQMSVEKDDQLLVKEKYEDGWWLVQKEATNEEGIVPGSYCHDIAANRRPSEPFISAHVS